MAACAVHLNLGSRANLSEEKPLTGKSLPQILGSSSGGTSPRHWNLWELGLGSRVSANSTVCDLETEFEIQVFVS